MAFVPIVDQEKCRGCEECVDICSLKVFEMQEDKAVPVQVGECIGCRSCVETCKSKAICVEEQQEDLSDVCSSLLRNIL